MYKLALIGRDVSLSPSPKVHGFIAKELGKEIAFDKISIPEERFTSEIEKILKTYDGFNVTIPYKLAVMDYLKSIKGDALAFGAVNTVVTADLCGYNTDGLGFMQMLDANGVNVNGKSALLLGAGGAGRSVAKKLADAGAKVEIYNRTFEKAEKVAAEFKGCTAVKKVVPKPRYLIVNATGVGMHETVGVSPVSAEIIKNCEVAVDLIYAPAKSEFLKVAESSGKKIINGAAMLFYQAYYADCLYFGLAPASKEAAKLFEKYQKETRL